MPSLIMKRGGKMLQSILVDGSTTSMTKTGNVCFSCDQIFANRKCLEDHLCPCASFICSCGTEFTEYKDMLVHSTTHEPGSQGLDHRTIKKRRMEKCQEEQLKLNRFHKGEVVWKSPSADSAPSVSGPNTSALMSQPSMKFSQVPQVPGLNANQSEASLLSKPIPQVTNMQNIFSGVGAPTVDLWTLYQPVVLVKSIRKFPKPYTCGKCGQGFVSKVSLISHNSSHVADKVHGCIGCGLLLSSRKYVPRFHTCNSPTSHSKFRLITAKPSHYKPPNARKDLMAQQPRVGAAQQLIKQSSSTATKGIQTPRITSLQKNLNVRTYNNNNNNVRGIQVGSHLQAKSQNLGASKTFTGVSLPSKSSNFNIFNQNSQKRYASSSALQMKPTNSPPPNKEGEFLCRVCHLPFKTPQILQRHKCVKAQEFMAKHVISGKPIQRVIQPTVSPNAVQVNGDRKLGCSPSVSTKKNQHVAVGQDKGKAAVPVNGNVIVEDDDDDDCYIVEGGTDKPAEVIYQVTSSVPIKT